jgi:Cu(I)/Ag(I) efflux system membrane fusion protein/cobalt-zinc-cadmium efflux system membrane fusion protein
MKRNVLPAALVILIVAGAVFFMRRSGGGSAGAVESQPAAAPPQELWTCSMHPQVLLPHPGLCPICRMPLTRLKTYGENSGGKGEGRELLYYWDPMLGPSSISNKPGKSAMGMDLVPVYKEQPAGPTVIIDPVIVQNMGVRTAQVVKGPLLRTIRAVAMVDVPDSAQYDVNLRIGGWIEKLYANQTGMHVLRGEPLFDLYSPDLQVAADELVGAESAMKSPDAQASPAVAAESAGMVDSARQKLRLWGIAERDIDAIAASSKAPRTVPIRSPIDGELVEKTVVDGSAVQAGERIMRIEDHHELWLDLAVYEQDLPYVALGETVTATAEAVPGKTFEGPISFIYPHMNHDSRTAMVRVRLDNPRHELRPGMYASAQIMTERLPDAILAPREAVIDTGTRQIAFVVESQGHFEPRKVRLGLVGDNDQVQIVEGLAPGETVVTSGQFLMDVESRTTEAIEKLRNAGGGNP